MIPRRDIGWRYWVATLGLLAVGLFGWPAGLYAAILFCAFQVGHFAWREKSLTAFPVQVRVAYLGLLLLGLCEPLSWIHWLQLIWTTARVTVGYCLLARTLSLLPWNRSETLSRDLLRRTYLTFGPEGLTCTTYRRPAWVTQR